MRLAIDEYNHIKIAIRNTVTIDVYEMERQRRISVCTRNGCTQEEAAKRVDHGLQAYIWNMAKLQRYANQELYPVGVSDSDIFNDVNEIQEELFGLTKLCMLWQNKYDRRHNERRAQSQQNQTLDSDDNYPNW